jgi:phosphatidate cytidylyltransferase
MVFKNASITGRRCFGALFLTPVVAAVWLNNSSAGVVVAMLSMVMAYEFSKMLKLPTFVTMAMVFVFALQAIPIWVLDVGVWWRLGLGFLAMAIAIAYQKYFAALFSLTLSFCFCSTVLLLAELDGHLLLLGLAAVVAASDITAYFAGRFVGGPKLAAKISPNKTVSGGFAGLVAAVVVMVMIAPLYGLEFLRAAQIGFYLGLSSQIGDLFESFVKRKVGVKDSGSILPGHGGLLDRFDGYIFSMPCFYFILFGI